MSVSHSVLQEAQRLLEEFRRRETIWTNSFRYLNNGALYDGGRTKGQTLTTLAYYEGAYKQDLKEISNTRDSLCYATSFSTRFRAAHQEFKAADETGPGVSLAKLYRQQSALEHAMDDLVAQIEGVSGYMLRTEPDRIEKLKKVLEDGNYKAAHKLIDNNPGFIKNLTRSQAQKRALKDDLSVLHTIVAEHEERGKDLSYIASHVDKLETATAKAIQSALRYSVVQDRLFTPGYNPLVTELAKSNPVFALMQDYRMTHAGMSVNQIKDRLREARGAISLDTLDSNMNALQRGLSAQLQASRLSYEQNFEKYYETKTLDRACRLGCRRDLSMPNGSARYESAIDVLGRAVSEAQRGLIDDETLHGIVTRAEQRTHSWTGKDELARIRADAHALGLQDQSPADVHTMPHDMPLFSQIFNNLARNFTRLTHKVMKSWTPV